MSHWEPPLSFSFGILAYIGPGAGIAIGTSFLVVLLAILSALLAMVSWPVRALWRLVRGRRARAKAQVPRAVVLGLDGLDPLLTEQMLDAGELPNLQKLRAQGGYVRLGTTYPPLSPVAWSSFSTGTNPGKHNIFDFIARHPETYRPEISSVRIRPPRRWLKLGRFRFPLAGAEIQGLRKSKPFWSLLGEAGIFSAILRVPITFPCDRFAGVQLAAMCVPDLLGTQGTYTLFAERTTNVDTEADTGSHHVPVERRGNAVHSYLEGPAAPSSDARQPPRLPFTIQATPAGGTLHLGHQQIELVRGELSDWVSVTFSLGPGLKLRGICRFLLQQVDPDFAMYVSPVQIDPDKPAMPISHPPIYASYLARQQGPFSTLGLAEDTTSLSDEVLSEDAFLAQAYDIHDEREAMFFDALEKVRRGLVVCVFDGPDRIQHMFWRFLEPDHPALANKRNTHSGTIPDMYRRMDDLVGRTVERVGKETALLVMSDHGFKPFRRAVDLNQWLLANGYLHLKTGQRSSDSRYLADVDWEQTSAYAMGLAGILINQQGREGHGIVPPGKPTEELVEKLSRQLTGLIDPETNQVAIHEAVPSARVYRGPYLDRAPDLLIGYNVGYRVSWESAVGKTAPEPFADNTKAWSGDHCIHPDLVPGVLFSNIPLGRSDPNIVDVAPTLLDLLGIATPSYMDGSSLLCDGDTSSNNC